MAKAYKGKLLTAPEDFELMAERLIVREDEVSFRLEGEDDDGQFHIEGTAKKTANGIYQSSKLALVYERWNGSYSAYIAFEKVLESVKGCEILGEWRQDKVSWTIRGRLTPF